MFCFQRFQWFHIPYKRYFYCFIRLFSLKNKEENISIKDWSNTRFKKLQNCYLVILDLIQFWNILTSNFCDWLATIRFCLKKVSDSKSRMLCNLLKYCSVWVQNFSIFRIWLDMNINTAMIKRWSNFNCIERHKENHVSQPLSSISSQYFQESSTKQGTNLNNLSGHSIMRIFTLDLNIVGRNVILHESKKNADWKRISARLEEIHKRHIGEIDRSSGDDDSPAGNLFGV